MRILILWCGGMEERIGLRSGQRALRAKKKRGGHEYPYIKAKESNKNVNDETKGVFEFERVSHSYANE